MIGQSVDKGTDIAVDPFRALVFPNAIREQRRRAGYESLLALSALLPHIPYIRLSKIERGEVIGKASELLEIAGALNVAPQSLLCDVEAPDFNLALWAGLRGEPISISREAEELAMLLAAAFRARRVADPDLTLARLQADFNLPAVIVSRIENAAKAPDRWNAATMESICRVLEVGNARELMEMLRTAHATGHLSPWLARIPGAADREAKTRAAIAKLRSDLDHHTQLPARNLRPPLARVAEPKAPPPRPASAPMAAPPTQKLIIYGAPAIDGCIDPAIRGEEIIAPANVGPRAYALRMGRPTLGSAIPGHAVLIVDPDRFPAQGGLAVVSEGALVRVVSITVDRDGRMLGHSVNPEKEIPLDTLAAGELAMVTAVLLG